MGIYKKNSLGFISLILFAYYSHAWSNILNLQQTVQYALQHSPSLNQLEQAQRISELEVDNARAKFLPNLDITSQHNIGQLEGSAANTSNGFGIRATEKLYDNGQSIIGYDKSKLQRESSDISYQQARDKLVRDVVVDILDLSLNKRLYKIQQANLKLLQQQYQQASQEYENGLRTEEDVVRFRNNVNNAKIAVLQAHTTIQQAKNNLLTSMGLLPNLARQQNIQFALFDAQDKQLEQHHFANPAIESQYEYQLRELQKEINHLDVRAAKRDYWPNVTLSAQAGYGNSTNLQNGFVSSFSSSQQFDWNVMLNFSYNLWDWGTRRNDIAIARHESRAKLDKFTAQVNDRAVAIDNTKINLAQLQKVYKISQQLLQSEKENYARIQQNYHEGKLTFLDLISAINSLSSAERQYITARYNLAKEFYRYQYNQGTIYATVLH